MSCADCGEHMSDDETTWIEYHDHSVCEHCANENYTYAYSRHGQTDVPRDNVIYCETDHEYYDIDYLGHYDIYECDHDGQFYHVDEMIFCDGGAYYVGYCVKLDHEHDGDNYCFNEFAHTLSDGSKCHRDDAEELPEALSERNDEAKGKKIAYALGGMARGVVPFSGFVNQTSEAAQNIWKMPQKQVNNAWQALIQNIPIARNSLNDKINALGDPVVKDIDVITSKETTDPVWKYLLDKKGWVAPVNRGTIIIYDEKEKMYRPVTGDEYYEFSKIRGQKIREELELDDE